MNYHDKRTTTTTTTVLGYNTPNPMATQVTEIRTESIPADYVIVPKSNIEGLIGFTDGHHNAADKGILLLPQNESPKLFQSESPKTTTKVDKKTEPEVRTKGPDFSFLDPDTETLLEMEEDSVSLETVIGDQKLPQVIEENLDDYCSAAIKFYFTMRDLAKSGELPKQERSVRGPAGEQNNTYTSVDTKAHVLIPIFLKNGIDIPSHRTLVQVSHLYCNRKSQGWARAMAKGRYDATKTPLKKGPKPKNPTDKKKVLTMRDIQEQLGLVV
jgi:hypothetical protein